MTYYEFYRRDLPHWQPPGAIFFVTFRTFGSLPKAVEDRLKLEAQQLRDNFRHLPGDAPEFVTAWKKLFKYADDHLDQSDGALYLADPRATAAVQASIYKGEELHHYRLHRYCIMGNHVHLLIEPLPVNASCNPGELPQELWPPVFYTEAGRALLVGNRKPEKLLWRRLSTIM